MAKGEKEHSVESKMFNVLKKIGVKLSSYHGGSLNGKVIKKVKNNATHIFEEFAVIFKEGRGKIASCPKKRSAGCACILKSCLCFGTRHFH